jgi:hypothetical protein
MLPISSWRRILRIRKGAFCSQRGNVLLPITASIWFKSQPAAESRVVEKRSWAASLCETLAVSYWFWISSAALQENTRRNAIGNTYNTAPLSFNPMSHVASNARQSSLYVGGFYLEERTYVNEEREIKQGNERENYVAFVCEERRQRLLDTPWGKCTGFPR